MSVENRKRIHTIDASQSCLSSVINNSETLFTEKKENQETCIYDVTSELPEFIPNGMIESMTTNLRNLTGYKKGKIPIDVIDIAKQLGYKVFEFDFSNNNISGVIDKEEKSITINKSQSYKRKLFTIAHEIGHLCLGHKAVVDYRLFTSNYDREEYQANLFASMLIMPKEEVAKAWRKHKNLEKLSDKFEVSKSAVAIRLLNLGLLEDDY